MYRSTGARGFYRGALLISIIGLSAVLTAGTVAIARGSQPSGSSDPFAAMPQPEAMDGPRVVPAAQVSYTVGTPRVRISGHRRLYRIDAATEQITKVRLAHFGLASFRAAEQLATFGGRQYVHIASGRWSGWWVRAPGVGPVVSDRYSSAEVELTVGVHNGVRFYANGGVRVRRPVYLASATKFSVSRRASFDGRDYYLVKDGPLADRWVQDWKGATLVSSQVTNQDAATETPAPTNPPSNPQPTAQPAPTAAPQPPAAPAASWKGVVLIYSETDVTYTRSDGTDYHLTSTMSSAMHDLLLDTLQRFGRSVNSWSGGLATMDLDIVEVPHAVTELDKLGDNYWLGPHSVRDDLNRYAPQGSYDSIFVVWKARDENERIPIGGWGLTMPPGSWANGAGYSSIITPSDMWWWTDSTNPEEVFVHEWMHQVLYWQEQHGRLTLDLHAGANYGYESVNGTWKRWLSDVMQGNVRDGNHDTGVDREMWAAGQPTQP